MIVYRSKPKLVSSLGVEGCSIRKRRIAERVDCTWIRVVIFLILQEPLVVVPSEPALPMALLSIRVQERGCHSRLAIWEWARSMVVRQCKHASQAWLLEEVIQIDM